MRATILFLILFHFFSITHSSAQWKQVPGAGTDIGVGANGTVWCLGLDAVPGGFPIYRWNGKAWDRIHGGAVKIDVDPNGNAWCVNDIGLIFYWNGNDWVTVGGQARDIGIGADGTVWCLGWNAVPGGYPIARWTGSYWKEVHGGAVRIDVDYRGSAWCVNDIELIFYWNGSDWVQVGGQGRDIGIGDKPGEVWLVGWNAVGGGYSVNKWNGSSWTGESGGLTNISVGKGEVWGVNNGGAIFRRPIDSRVTDLKDAIQIGGFGRMTKMNGLLASITIVNSPDMIFQELQNTLEMFTFQVFEVAPNCSEKPVAYSDVQVIRRLDARNNIIYDLAFLGLKKGVKYNILATQTGNWFTTKKSRHAVDRFATLVLPAECNKAGVVGAKSIELKFYVHEVLY